MTLYNAMRHTSRLIPYPPHRIAAREGLESDSDIMLEQTRTIDKRRMTSAMLTILTEKEISDVEAYWRIVIGL